MAGDLEKQGGGTEEPGKIETKGTPSEQAVEPPTLHTVEALARLEQLKTRYGVSKPQFPQKVSVAFAQQ